MRGFLMISRFIGRISLAGLLMFVAAPWPLLLSQSTQTNQASSKRNAKGFADAENRWQLNPVDILRDTDSVEPRIRAARNSYWQSIFQKARDIEAEEAGNGIRSLPASGYSRGYFYPALIPEIPSTPNSTWVIAKFTSYHIIPIDQDYRDFYTEENFKVIQIIQQPLQGVLAAGDRFDVDLGGGTIITPQRQTINHTSPVPLMEQPRHTYLLQLVSKSNDTFEITKRWDVSNNKVTPDTKIEVLRASEGTAKLSGMSIFDAVQYIQSELSKEPLQ